MYQPAIFIRWPATIENDDSAFADFPQLVDPLQSSITGSRKIIAHQNFQRVLTSNPREKSPARSDHQYWNWRSLSSTLSYAPEKQSPGEAMPDRSEDDQSRFEFCCRCHQLVKRRTRKKLFLDPGS